MKKIILATLGMGLLAMGGVATAATSTITIAPSLTISGSCSLDASGVSGVFPAQTTDSTANGIVMAGGTLTVDCPAIDYKVGANEGSNSAGTAATTSPVVPASAGLRQLKSAVAGGVIPYILTIDSGSGAVNWGDANLTGATGLVADSALAINGDGSVKSFIISGMTTSALSGTNAEGVYSDSVTITVEW